MTTTFQLLDLPTQELLNKIGMGKHKPGSGSAAALNGIISCKLLLTVIKLTTSPDRKGYSPEIKEQCRFLEKRISEEIGGELERLFEEDSVQFDQAIQKRQKRDSETEQAKKNMLDQEALEELVRSTELPLEIAKHAIDLANYSLYIFDNGFKSARGDSGVALSSAISCLAGCIAIVSLNLKSFPGSEWTKEIINDRDKIQLCYEELLLENQKRLKILSAEAESSNIFLAEIQRIKKHLHGKDNISSREIEQLARDLQNLLWKNRDRVWPNTPPDKHIDALSAPRVIRLLKYALIKVDSLGVTDSNVEIAGTINNETCTIRVATEFEPVVQRFTVAHELGHALLHSELHLHRDIKRDGSDTSPARPLIEKQADKFASFFLMPRKQVEKVFVELFGVQQLALEPSVASNLGISLRRFRANADSLRDFSRLIATATFYEDRSFSSLASIFKVSNEAMAIRLEELGLVNFNL